MSSKKYCFIPETYKKISIYNPGTINTSKNSLTASELIGITPSTTFKYCIDDYDKIRLFYLDGKRVPNTIEDEYYFIEKTVTAIKSIFKGVTELIGYKLVMDDNPRIEFSIFFDVDGNFVPLSKMIAENKSKTIVGHSYTYNFFKRYNY